MTPDKGLHTAIGAGFLIATPDAADFPAALDMARSHLATDA